jgi:hypothetical protein
METLYYLLFGVLAAAAAVLELSRSKESGHASMSREFLAFRNNYVLVYSLMMGMVLPKSLRSGYGQKVLKFHINGWFISHLLNDVGILTPKGSFRWAWVVTSSWTRGDPNSLSSTVIPALVAQ